ncbi:MAG TPA: DUF4340 domain-containing protein [Candidatus Latescibacteria bacterium]|nr:DUF4340 domain-containing protein [Candidatus Latescibacterota bacterium]
MRFKGTLVLAVIFAALGTYVYLYEVKGGAKRERAKELAKKVFPFEEDEVKGLSLRYSGRTVVCSKEQEGEWKITSPVETDGDKTAIERIVTDLRNLKFDRVVVDSAAQLSEFGLSDPEVEVSLELEEGATDTLLLGDKSPTGSYVFAKRSSQPEVFTLSAWTLDSMRKTLYDLRDKRVLAFEKDEVKKLELSQKGKKIVCTKSDSKWQMEVPIRVKADKGEVEGMLNKLNNSRVKEFVSEEPKDLSKYGLDKPRLEVTLWIGEHMAKKLLKIGNMDRDRYYAKDESRNPVFLVESDLVKELGKEVFDLRDKTVAEFEKDDVNRVELVYADSSIVCVKDTVGNWMIVKPVERKAKRWKVNSILSDIKYLKAKEFVAERAPKLSRYGLDNPQIEARLWKDEKLLVSLLIGKKKDNSVYAKTGQKETVYLVSSNIVDDLSLKVDDIAEEAGEK